MYFTKKELTIIAVALDYFNDEVTDKADSTEDYCEDEIAGYKSDAAASYRVLRKIHGGK